MSDAHELPSASVGIFGGTGFVGSAVGRALGAGSKNLLSPRISTSARALTDLIDAIDQHGELIERAAAEMGGMRTVVVASGMPDATGPASDALYGANALLPGILLLAASKAGVKRLVHVSSAVVQGGRSKLDSAAEWSTTSAYGDSKKLGEQVLLRLAEGHDVEVVIYRPPSVHAESRRITQVLTRIASSPVATVPRGVNASTPQALLENVASAITWLSRYEGAVPLIVHHPAEGVTVSSLLQDLGDAAPKRIPVWAARAIDRLLKTICNFLPPLAPHSRRLELLWFGQAQAESWLTTSGWTNVAGRERWAQMGRALRNAK